MIEPLNKTNAEFSNDFRLSLEGIDDIHYEEVIFEL